MNVFTSVVKRRYRRMRRRRKIGRAYDMALEIAPLIPAFANVLDVGCGNGFIAHHLKSLLDCRVTGIDVLQTTTASIQYIPYDGRHFPLKDNSVDAILLCYVLHHAQDLSLVLNEIRRVLRIGGKVVIYEDTPRLKWDRVVCWVHNLQWQSRTGSCSFHGENDWKKIFAVAGFDVIQQRRLSRWRNFAHPVSRTFFILTNNSPIEPQLVDRRMPELAVLDEIYLGT